MKKTKKLIVGNWKMNPIDWEEGKVLLAGLKRGIAKHKGKLSDMVVCPPNIYLRDTVKSVGKVKLGVGVQDVSPFENVGSKTGSISAMMHKNSGAQYAIIGHSERRDAGETDEEVNKKVHLALRAGLKVIVCVGEKTREANGAYLEFIKEQLRKGLEKIERKMLREVIVAYEPVWAIGAKEAMTPYDLHQTSLYIRKVLMEIFGADWGGHVAVLYGGAVDAMNTLGIVRDGAVDGLLVGRQSLIATEFLDIALAAALA